MELDESLWYQTHGYFNNPFSIKPGAFHEELVGPQKVVKDINNALATGNVIFVVGEYGAGKTTMMKRIIGRFKNEEKVVYFSCSRKAGSVNFDKLLYGRTFFNKLFKFKSKDMILLLDEVYDLNKKEQADIVGLYETGYFKSVALITKEKRDIKFSKDLKDLIGKKIFVMKNLSGKDAVELVRKRIGPNNLLSDIMIKRICLMNSNPRAILENCEDICKFAVENGSDKVLAKHLKVLKKK